ncbi:DYW family of nucleic acid deaminases-domain-containing protein [Aspergillus floccosus]
MEKTFPEADVIWWNSKLHYVQCPFCEAVHQHGVKWSTDNLRYSHCEKMETYLCCFPMNDRGEVAYEIDKRRGRYINICVSHDSDNENDDDVDRLAIELAQKATLAAQREETYGDIYEDSKEMITVDPGCDEPFQQKRIYGAISACVTGNIRAVQKYLETSSEVQLFVQGRFSDGKTTLIKVNAVDNDGRSALMEAALFGRIDNVKVLLQHDAEKNIRDGEHRLAIDLARDHYKNRREVYERTGGDLTSSSIRRLGYIEDTFKRDIDRREIVRLLGGEDRKSKIVFGRPPTLSLSTSYSFTPPQRHDSLVLRGPIEEYPITSRWKTVARLERGGNFPSIGAMSGWSHDSVQSLMVDGRQWTDDVFYIAAVLVHHLPPHDHDRGEDGRYYACHAEKQLIAYFIDRHVFLPRDYFPDSELDDEIERVEDELEQCLSDSEIGHEVTSLRQKKKDLEYELFDGDEKLVGKYDQIKALKLQLKSVEATLNRLIADSQVQPILKLESQLKILYQRQNGHANLINMTAAPPRASLTEAVILISSPPCQDCVAFKDKVNEVFGLSIQLFAAL